MSWRRSNITTFVCHLKTPQHCTSCASNPVSTSPLAFSGPGVVHLADAGSAVTLLPFFETALLAVQSTGRSPPATI